MAVVCKECSGTGVVGFTKERGGPDCNTCGGTGEITPDVLVPVIASLLDSPSVYMGGPSQQSRKRAARIVELLHDYGVL